MLFRGISARYVLYAFQVGLVVCLTENTPEKARSGGELGLWDSVFLAVDIRLRHSSCTGQRVRSHI